MRSKVSNRMTLNDRLLLLEKLGRYVAVHDERLQAYVERSSVDNPWFTKDNIRFAMDTIAHTMLDGEILRKWTQEIKDPAGQRRIEVIMAGNIPAAGFHDMLCVFVAGHCAVIKLSDKDKHLIPFFIGLMCAWDERASGYFELVDKLKDYDAVIATGSNNSARYFEYYFAGVPHIIRRNRNAVAVIDGSETEEALAGLCRDIFLYFGLGCRSVSHLYVPHGYDFDPLLTQMDDYVHLAAHEKYRNNLDYHAAIHILNKTPHIARPNVILAEQDTLISPVGCLYYTNYYSAGEVAHDLSQRLDEIQCVVTGIQLPGLPVVPFGQAQCPAVDDYADGVNTLEFIDNLQ